MNVNPTITTALQPLRILLIADAIGATQQISFLLPLQSAIACGEIALYLEDQSSLTGELPRFGGGFGADLVILSRLTLLDARSLIDDAHAVSVPCIFHVDDDLLDVPKSLGSKKFDAYNRPDRILNLRANMKSADLLYTSTPALADALSTHGIGTPVIAGEVYCTVDPSAIRPALPAMTPVIGYMGSEGHAADLAMLLPAIEHLMDVMPTLRFETYGTIPLPPELARFGARVNGHPPTRNYAEFVAKLCALGWWIGLAPLEDTAFNRCKADTKWVEYSYAGIATIASDLPVYHRACADGAGVLARDLNDWYEAMLTLLRDPEMRGILVDRAQAKLVRSYTHATLEHQLHRVFASARSAANARSGRLLSGQTLSERA